MWDGQGRRSGQRPRGEGAGEAEGEQLLDGGGISQTLEGNQIGIATLHRSIMDRCSLFAMP